MAPTGTRAVWAQDKIEQALREDVEAGVVSYNDFERTKEFASEAIRYQYLASIAGVGAVAGTVFYRHWYRRQPFNLRSIIFLPLIYTMGSAPCWFAQANAFRRYQHELEDPNTTMRALMKSRGVTVINAGENPGHSQVDTANFGETDKRTDNIARTRWEELRRETDTARPSTWDNIRQSHERRSRRKPTQPERLDPGTDSANAEEQNHPLSQREIEQAKFDALLEAERKMSES